MSNHTFQPSPHSSNSYSGYAGPLVHVERNPAHDEMGFFIAEDNEGMGLGSVLWSGVTLAISAAGSSSRGASGGSMTSARQ